MRLRMAEVTGLEALVSRPDLAPRELCSVQAQLYPIHSSLERELCCISCLSFWFY